MHPGFKKLTLMTDSGSQRLKRKQIRTADDPPINEEERYVSYGEFVANIPVFVKFPPRPIQNLLSILLLLCCSKILLISNFVLPVYYKEFKERNGRPKFRPRFRGFLPYAPRTLVSSTALPVRQEKKAEDPHS